MYTDSPHWKEYIEERWVKRWPDRMVTLNRSRPWSRTQPEAALWLWMMGPIEHTPMAIVVPRRGRVHIIRFFKAFRDLKHGKAMPLQLAEADLVETLERNERTE